MLSPDSEQGRRDWRPKRHTLREVSHYARVKIYPHGGAEIMAAEMPVFRAPGWEPAEDARPLAALRRRADEGANDSEEEAPVEAQGPNVENVARAVRRARSRIREIALCNHMTHMVTLTYSDAVCDRHDLGDTLPRCLRWLHNQVQRKGLYYVLIPELHKDGALHWHGLCNAACLGLVESGTMIPPEGGRPRRPTSGAERAAWAADGGVLVYNVQSWRNGFSTAVPLHGSYEAAVGYVCKYVGKDMGAAVSPGKIGGRWYYSGGDLRGPDVYYTELTPGDLVAAGGIAWAVPGCGYAMLRGSRDQVSKVLAAAGAPGADNIDFTIT